jgi:hypothetical protein
MFIRERIPFRRVNHSVSFEFEGHRYRATAGRYADGRLAEVFLDVSGRLGSQLATNASTEAILTSIALQHGAAPEVIRHAVIGPIAIALSKFLEGK